MLVVLFCNLVCIYKCIYVRISSAFAVFFLVNSESKRLPRTNFVAELHERKYSNDIHL